MLMWLQIWIRSNYFSNGIKMFVPVTKMKSALCGVETSKYYFADFEAPNWQFTQEENEMFDIVTECRCRVWHDCFFGARLLVWICARRPGTWFWFQNLVCRHSPTALKYRDSGVWVTLCHHRFLPHPCHTWLQYFVLKSKR